MTIHEMIKRFDITLHGPDQLRVGNGSLAKTYLAELKAAKADIIAELKAMKDAKKAAEKAAIQERESEIASIRNSEKEIVVRWREGEILSGYAVSGPAAEILKEAGVAKEVHGWGTLVDEKMVEKLGERFTFAEVEKYRRPQREARLAALRSRQSFFETAKRTGKRVLLGSWSEPCSSPSEECDIDNVREYAMPDGSPKVERTHTW